MLKFGNKSDTGGGLKQPTAHQFFNLFIKLNPVMGVGGSFWEVQIEYSYWPKTVLIAPYVRSLISWLIRQIWWQQTENKLKSSVICTVLYIGNKLQFYNTVHKSGPRCRRCSPLEKFWLVNTPLVHQYQAPDLKLALADPHKMNIVDKIFFDL